MSQLLSNPDFRGARHIPSNMKEAVLGVLPTTTSKSPCGTAKLNALINYLWKKMKGTTNNIPVVEQNAVRLQFRSYARRCSQSMKDDGILETGWGKLSRQYQLYYSLKLERVIFEKYHYPIHECRNQWAARVLLMENMKGRRQTARRQIVCRKNTQLLVY